MKRRSISERFSPETGLTPDLAEANMLLRQARFPHEISVYRKHVLSSDYGSKRNRELQRVIYWAADHHAPVVREFEGMSDKFNPPVEWMDQWETALLNGVDAVECTEWDKQELLAFLGDAEAFPMFVRPEHEVRFIREEHARSKLYETLVKAADYVASDKCDDGGDRAAQRMVKRIGEIYDASVGIDQDNNKLIDEVQRKLSAAGIPWPYPQIQDELGYLMPGELILVSGYSGNGKTQFAANLANKLRQQNVPTIVFATEMGVQWVVRLAAIHAGVNQFKAEKNAWDPNDVIDEHERIELERALQDIRGWKSLHVDVTGSITAEEIERRVRQIRAAKYAGEHVVVIVDHLHRLKYTGEADMQVGESAKVFKNLANDDRDGLTVVGLAQPRKPEGTGNLYAPVRGHQLRGHSGLINEADAHFSVFRMYVEVDTYGRSVMENGRPKFRFPKSGEDFKKEMPAGVGLCVDHTFINVDKRRVGGEGGVLSLPFNIHSGTIGVRGETTK